MIPLSRILTIAQSCARYYRDEFDPEFEDYLQDILLGIFQRIQGRSGSDFFVMFIARQKAWDGEKARRQYWEFMHQNHRGRLLRHRPVQSVDDLADWDIPLRLAQFASCLDAEATAAWEQLLRGELPADSEVFDQLKADAEEFCRSPKLFFENKGIGITL
jgi:hypothetical protein